MYYVLVSEIPSTNRTFQEQKDGVWRGSGALRISVAHARRDCPYMNHRLRDKDHSRIVPLPSSLLEHRLFTDLGTCSHCVQEEVR